MKLPFNKLMKILAKEADKLAIPIVTYYTNQKRDPFKILISTVLSLRTKDQTTQKATDRLFRVIKTPIELSKLSIKRIEKLIYPVGFYKTKAKRLKEICKILIKEYKSKVPDEIDVLLKLPGVGRKTANLVVGLGYNKPALCIDTHCHRFPNRLGLIKTKDPIKTEFTLRKIMPQKYWIKYNDYVVAFGQNICKPVGPKCGECPLRKYCRYYEEIWLEKHQC